MSAHIRTVFYLAVLVLYLKVLISWPEITGYVILGLMAIGLTVFLCVRAYDKCMAELGLKKCGKYSNARHKNLEGR